MTWIAAARIGLLDGAGLPRADAGGALLGWRDHIPIQQEPTMNHSSRQADPAAKGPNVLHEADIGSGEKSPGEMETEEMIREIPPLPPSGKPGEASSGTPDKPSA